MRTRRAPADARRSSPFAKVAPRSLAEGVAAQALWIVYALATGQYGFIISALAYAAIYARNWWKWAHPEPSPGT